MALVILLGLLGLTLVAIELRRPGAVSKRVREAPTYIVGQRLYDPRRWNASGKVLAAWIVGFPAFLIFNGAAAALWAELIRPVDQSHAVAYTLAVGRRVLGYAEIWFIGFLLITGVVIFEWQQNANFREWPEFWIRYDGGPDRRWHWVINHRFWTRGWFLDSGKAICGASDMVPARRSNLPRPISKKFDHVPPDACPICARKYQAAHPQQGAGSPMAPNASSQPDPDR